MKRLAQLLNEAGGSYALVGGYALAAHGYHRFTEDVDAQLLRQALNRG